MHALVTGTVTHPVVLVTAKDDEPHRVTGVPIGGWIRRLPRVRRGTDGRWHLIHIGPDAAETLRAAGFSVDVDEHLVAQGLTIDNLSSPLAVPHPSTGHALIHPRLTGIAHIADQVAGSVQLEGSDWAVLVPLTAIHPAPDGITLSPALPNRLSRPPQLPDPVRAAARRLAAAQDLDSPALRADYATVTGSVGDIPDWFGLELDPYQRAGAVAAAAGHSAVCDPPGLGKTRTLLAALAIRGCRRAVIVTPPSPVVTHWQREAQACRLADHTGPGGALVTLQAGRRHPPLPTSGVVIVPDTLLAARPDVVDALIAWRPDGVAVDEVHRTKTWDTRRSRAVRAVARACDGIRLAASGTPMLANAHEMCSMLAITGHLDPVFGGRGQYEQQFCRQNRYGAWSSRRRALPRLKTLLDAQVWVRRRKVMPTTKRRYVEFLDPNPATWRTAHTDVHRTIDAYLASVITASGGQAPTREQIAAWAGTQLGLITQLRRAAGLAKVQGIADRAAAWVEGYTEVDEDTGERTHLRPLIIWTWHRDVSEALAAAVPARIGSAGVIIGTTKPAERSRLVDAFQAGQVPVLVCSIPTVGVGVTLTRGSDCWFAEVSFTPAEVSQAEDRQFRRGQERQVRVTTFIAPGTLDERLQDILGRKADELNVIMSGGDNDVTVIGRSSKAQAQDLLVQLVEERVPVVSRRLRRAA